MYSLIIDISNAYKCKSQAFEVSIINKQTGLKQNTLTLTICIIHTYNYRDGGTPTTPTTPTVETEDESADGATGLIVMEQARNKGGRPQGTTLKRKRTTNLAVTAATNEIASVYANKMDEKKMTSGCAQQRVSKNMLVQLIDEIKTKNNIPSNVDIKPSTIKKRILRGNIFSEGVGGHRSPLLPLEPVFVSAIVQMARIRQSLTPSQGLALVNGMIEGTREQANLISFKEKYCISTEEDMGKVGRGYWRGFRKRNNHLLVSKRGQKYELDRSMWSTYANFKQMYDQVGDELVDAGVARKLETAVWMDKSGVECAEKDVYGCKVTIDITDPDWVLVMDEVGGNTNQKGDGNVGGELQLCERGKVPKRKINTKDKHYTLLGLTSIAGKPVMCIVIFAGETPNTLTETGLDLDAETYGCPTDADFFEQNSGPGKRFPGGPTCHFNGVDVPCLCRWSTKGSITAEILKDILETLDHLEVFRRDERMKPFLLVDGHHSRLELPFLQYICNPLHLWAVCIGVPYCTDLWQVGDAPEQNGAHNQASVVEKRNIMERKEKQMYNRPTIETYEIIQIINKAWAQSFARVNSNKKAIAERGWYPYNRQLMTSPHIRSSITAEEEENELLPNSSVILPIQTRESIIDLSHSEPTVNPTFLSPTPVTATPNFTTGVAAWCLDSIVKDHDLNAARVRIKKNLQDGKSLKEKLIESKRITAGRLFKAGSCRIGKTIFDLHKEKRFKEEQERTQALQTTKETYRKAKEAAAAVIATQPDPSKWSIAQLKVMLKPLKKKEDGAMPTLKAKMLEKYLLWMQRDPPSFDDAAVVLAAAAAKGTVAVEAAGEEEDQDDELTTEEEAVEAMLSLFDTEVV